ncbi:alpha/beta fold hydrolase [Paraburkholderia terrae]|uniref:alpha/beta fold hydrolase n=1 Tax=Paraburkholderia terrae TaxID=311230 RepID=UPI00296ACE5A|nr:alpha/beta hydrolase [Paraburkholderia terrae]MDW3656284.1 alpha/beta hydrolase [Paraburkholderia terrae]
MMERVRIRSLFGLLLTAAISSAPASGQAWHDSRVSYRVANVDGLSIFYREAGPRDAPTVLLLHGFPSSSRMFEPLLKRLGDQYHLVAPDFPGFGHSDAPAPTSFAYTFDHIAAVTNRFVETLGLKSYVIYMQDYGGPVGFRVAMAHPERVNALIIQNAVAHEDGLGPLWNTRRAFWVDRQANQAAVEQNLMSLQAAKQRHIGTSPNVESYDPDLWTDEYAFLSRPGQREIQSDLFYDYRTNVASYPRWQAWLQKTQPRTLVVWGRYDPSFLPAEADAYRRDLPKAEIHVLDAGHFALDEKPDEIAELIRGFLAVKNQ